jgi:hypothetical protein
MAVARPAHAQFSSLREAGTETTINVKGKVRLFKPITVFFSPDTLFQRDFARVSGANIYSVQENDAGPLIGLEKLYLLDLRPTYIKTHPGSAGSSFTLGTWYWYNSSHLDRFAVYGKYFLNGRIGVQGSFGGDSHLGLYEYYGFVLYNALRATSTNKFAVQLGVGPYLPRQSLGNLGYNATAAVAYSVNSDLSVVASIWYVNFEQDFPTFGFNRNSSTVRYTVGVGYSF